jgi:hypothetical protein
MGTGTALAQAQFRMLVSDSGNHRIRVLSADLLQVSTVAGNGRYGHRDGAAAQARIFGPSSFELLPDGRVLVSDHDVSYIRVLSTDLQHVSTLTNVGELVDPDAFALLPDGRLLVGA